MLDNLGNLERTHSCGDLRAGDVGKQVVLMGWVAKRRDFGELTFVDLRDRAGITQAVFNADEAPEAHARAKELRNEYVIAVIGTVVLRADNTRNPKLATGDVEVQARQVFILNDARTPPFQLDAAPDALASEDLRLKYRYLDLRRPQLQSNMLLRHRVLNEIRRYMTAAGFYRNRNTDPHQIDAGRRARLHRSFTHLSRKVFCAAAVATALQTVVHDRRYGQVFSDRALLS